MSRRFLAPLALVLGLVLASLLPARADDAKKCALCDTTRKLVGDLRCPICKGAPQICDRCQDSHAKLTDKCVCKACAKTKTGTCPDCEKALKAASGCAVCAAKALVVAHVFCGEKCEKAGKPCEQCTEARAAVSAIHCSSDTGQDGPVKVLSFQNQVPRKSGVAATALVYYPSEEKGPFPAVVFSPGGDADSVYGYEAFGQRFATWGFVVAIVAFNDQSADERAAQFSEIVDWFGKRNVEENCALKGKIDMKRIVACGHSRGGWAAIVAATSDKRFTACLALAPASPENLSGSNRPPLCIVSGDSEPADVESAKTTFKLFEKPKYRVTVKGVPHMLHRDPKTDLVVAHAAAFLTYKVRGDAHAKKFLQAETADVSVVSEE